MRFTLSPLGDQISRPLDAGFVGAIEDALLEAKTMLECNPACEAVEIFSEGRFVGDVARRAN